MRLTPVFAALACLAALVTSPPARAADVATLNCVIGKIEPQLRAAMEADFEQAMTQAGVALSPANDAQLVSRAADCARQFSWSEAARNAAIAWSRATIARPVAERYLRARGFDVDRILAIWTAIPAATRLHRLDNEALTSLGKALYDAGVFKKEGDPTIVGKFIVYLSTSEFCRQDFIDG